MQTKVYGNKKHFWPSGEVLKHGHALIGNAETMSNIVCLEAAILACVEWRELMPVDVPLQIPMTALEKFQEMAQKWKEEDLEFQARFLFEQTQEGKWKLHTLWASPQEATNVHTQLLDNLEEAIMLQRYVAEHNLKELVWAHTHPSFGAFLSSIDQHQAAYMQSDNPIACSFVFDKHGMAKIYRMTGEGLWGPYASL